MNSVGYYCSFCNRAFDKKWILDRHFFTCRAIPNNNNCGDVSKIPYISNNISSYNESRSQKD